MTSLLLPEATTPATEELQIYVELIRPSIIEAVRVPRVSVSHNGWQPEFRKCHHNVVKWKELYPVCEIICGWLVFDLRATLGRTDLVAHSVIKSEDGTLMDITPVQSPAIYPFVRHIGDFEHYVTLIDEQLIARISLYEDGRITFGDR